MMGNEQPPGLKKFEVRPIKKQVKIDPSIHGTAVVGLLGVIAWLLVVLSPIISIGLMAVGLRVMIPEMASNAVNDVINNFFENFTFSVDSFSELYGFWDVFGALVSNVGGSVGMLVLGFVLLAIVLILLFCMITALRNNCNTARVLQIISFILCSLSSYLFYSVAARISEAVDILEAPYDSGPMIAIIMAIAAVVLWAVSIVIYFSQIEKSKSYNAQM